LVHLSSGPPFPNLLTSHLYAVFIIHLIKDVFLSLSCLWSIGTQLPAQMMGRTIKSTNLKSTVI